MDMEVPYSQLDIIEAKKKLLIANELQNAYVRPIVWRVVK